MTSCVAVSGIWPVVPYPSTVSVNVPSPTTLAGMTSLWICPVVPLAGETIDVGSRPVEFSVSRSKVFVPNVRSSE